MIHESLQETELEWDEHGIRSLFEEALEICGENQHRNHPEWRLPPYDE
jgi:hypothetical protein